MRARQFQDVAKVLNEEQAGLDAMLTAAAVHGDSDGFQAILPMRRSRPLSRGGTRPGDCVPVIRPSSEFSAAHRNPSQRLVHCRGDPMLLFHPYAGQKERGTMSYAAPR
jgi:hypothetical protein